MASWIMRRAQADRSRLEAVQKGGALWEQVRQQMQKSVSEFNSLYADLPDRQAEYSETAGSVVVKLKTRPNVCTELHWDAASARIRYAIAMQHYSQLAAESSIFGFGEPEREIHAEIDESGAPCLKSAGQVIPPQDLVEAVLARVLFPA